jgi:hypothetical protein
LKQSRVQCTKYHAHLLVILPIVLTVLLLPAGGFSEAAGTTSHIKKPLIYQIGNVVHINADGERPLLRAVDALREKYGWIVDYEDPPYAADAATSVPSPASRRHANARSSGREGFGVEFTVEPAPDGRPDENSVLTTVVNAYNENNAVAQFELRSENDHRSDNESDNKNAKQQERRFDVVGTDSGDHRDQAESQQPILSLLITLAKEPRTAEQTIALICRQVSEQSKIPVSVGAIDDKVNGGRWVAIGGTDAPARTLLLRTLVATGDHLSWRLLYDAASKSYDFSVSGLSQ